jgi:hypothetical protein
MLRKGFIVSALFLSILAISNPVWAQSCPTPDGYYLLDGKLGAKANFPGFATLSLKLPDLERIEALAFFDSSGVFSLFLPLLSEAPLLSGSWAMECPTDFTVDSGIDLLIGELAQLGIDAEITSRSFSGTRQSDGTIKGNFNLGISIGLLGIQAGTITIKGSFTGAPTAAPVSILSAGLPLPDPAGQEGSRGTSILADLILKILKKIPVH